MLSKRMFLVVILLFTTQLFAKSTDAMIQNALDKFEKELKSLNVSIKKVAVYHISANKAGVDTVSIQDQLTDMVLKSGKFKVIDRQSLNALLKEQSLSLTGMVDNEAMVKAGKLIGVEGFFFGNINVEKNRVVFTIKLIEVESSALLYSKTIIGEDYSSIELGIAGGYCTGYSYNGIYNYYYNDFPDHHVPFDPPVKEVIHTAMDFPQFTLIYVQGFKNSKNFKFGLNITYAPETDDISNLEKELTYWQDEYNLFVTNSKTSTSLNYLSFDPSAIIMPGFLGWDSDLLALTLGASLHFYWFDISSSTSGPTYSTHEKQITKIAVFPTLGIIFKPVNFIHLFAKAIYIPNDIVFSDEILISGGGGSQTIIVQEPYIEKGFVYNIGVGFSYTF